MERLASVPRQKRRVRVLVCGLLVCGAFVAAASAQEMPAGEGRAVAVSRCSSCHGMDIIRQQRLSEAAWTREIAKMAGWGAQIADAERVTLAGYLAAHFGAAPPAAPAPAAEDVGKQTFERGCLSCHGAEMVTQQRLSAAAWTREVEKMTGWGAQVPAAEKDGLVRFLASHYGPAPR